MRKFFGITLSVKNNQRTKINDDRLGQLMTNVREAFLDISFFSFFKIIERTGRGKYFLF